MMKKVRPKKQSDVVLIGAGPLIESIKNILGHSGCSVIMLPDAESVYFLSRRVIVYAGERIAAKRFFIVLPNQRTVPVLRGLDTTSYITLGEETNFSQSGKVLIVGGHELAVNAAMSASTTKSEVHMAYPSETLLVNYDVSVQEVVTRYLRKQKVGLFSAHTPIASRTKNNKTNLLTKTNESTRELECGTLYIEPNETSSNDMGLSKLGVHIAEINNTVLSSKNLTIIDGERLITSIDDAQQYAKVLLGKRASSPSLVQDNQFTALGVRLFSFGILEQNFIDTHIGYNKSISKLTIPGIDITGFIKVVTSLTGKIVGVSGILPIGYSGIDTFRFAVKDRLKISALAKQISVEDPLRSSYLEIFRELR